MKYKIKTGFKDSPGGIVDKDPPANAGHTNCRPLAAGRLSPFPQLLSLCCVLNTCHVPNTGLDAQGRNSRIRSLVLGAYPLGAYSLQRKEEEKSNEVPWRVEDDKLAWPLFF